MTADSVMADKGRAWRADVTVTVIETSSTERRQRKMNRVFNAWKWRQLGVLAVLIGVLSAAGVVLVAAAEGEWSGRQGDRDQMSEMMRGMRTGPSVELLGRERPLLSLALRHRTELGLSADRVKTLEGMVEGFRTEAEARASRIDSAEQELAALLRSDPIDLAAVEAKVRAIEALRADLRMARIRTIAEGRAALTAEQRKKLEELVAGRPGGSAGPRTCAMMDMARGMGDGDMMLGMVRMMEMMGSMGRMMGGSGSGMMGGPPHQPTPPEQK